MTNNREIKFRGMLTKERVWVYGIYDPYRYRIGSYLRELQTEPFWHYVDHETVGQYTGLKDKNGNEIYKGDIVEFFGMKGRIVKECGAFGIGTSRQINYDKLETKMPYGNSPAFCYNDNFISLWELWWNYEQDDNPLYEVEVIGNIYENPELLEVK